jgi:hypothetical protein
MISSVRFFSPWILSHPNFEPSHNEVVPFNRQRVHKWFRVKEARSPT